MTIFKKINWIFLGFMSVNYLYSCGNGSGSDSNQLVQHDTMKTNSMISSSKDSILQNGEYIKHYKNSVIEIQGIMKDGKRDGLWKSFYENGLPWSETTFLEGKKEGKTTTWYDNNQKRYEGFYTNDFESGKWTFWDEKGKQVNTTDYGKK